MILVCEPVCWGLEHVPVNSALLATIRLAFPYESILFYAEKSHLECVRIQLGEELASSIVWKTLVLPPKNEKFFNRLASDLKLLRHLLKELSKETAGHLLLTSGCPSVLWALKGLLGSVHRGKHVQFIFHGGLASLAGWRSRNPIIRIQDLRTALSMPSNRNIQYIALEQPIREGLLQELPSLHGRIGVLDHPIPINEGPNPIVNFNPPFRFGFLGLATEQKGFFKYLNVASEITAKFPARAEFHAIGSLPNDYKHLYIPEIASLRTKPGKDQLDRNQFVRHLRKLHFVCLFCQGRHYEFSASGVLLDSVAWEKPIIASKLSIFEHLEARFGDVGYLCKSDAFSETVATIIKEADQARYEHQVLTLRRVKKSRAPEVLAKKYRKLCEGLRIK